MLLNLIHSITLCVLASPDSRWEQENEFLVKGTVGPKNAKMPNMAQVEKYVSYLFELYGTDNNSFLEKREKSIRILSYEIVGQSTEHQPLKMYIIKKNTGLSTVITSMIHPREPLSLLTNVSLFGKLLRANELITSHISGSIQLSKKEFEENLKYYYIVENSVIYILLYHNPDGWREIEKTSNYLIRKNRFQGTVSCLTTDELGIDLNRNFAHNWKLDDPCSEEYGGSRPASSAENTGLINFYRNHKISMALNLHTFGDVLTYPYNSGQSDPSVYNPSVYPRSASQYKHIFSQSSDNLDLPKGLAQLYDEMGKTFDGVNYGSSKKTLDYMTSGEQEDYLLDAFGIVAMAPELGKEEHRMWITSDLIPSELKINLTKISNLLLYNTPLLRCSHEINENTSLLQSPLSLSGRQLLNSRDIDSENDSVVKTGDQLWYSGENLVLSNKPQNEILDSEKSKSQRIPIDVNNKLTEVFGEDPTRNSLSCSLRIVSAGLAQFRNISLELEFPSNIILPKIFIALRTTKEFIVLETVVTDNRAKIVNLSLNPRTEYLMELYGSGSIPENAKPINLKVYQSNLVSTYDLSTVKKDLKSTLPTFSYIPDAQIKSYVKREEKKQLWILYIIFLFIVLIIITLIYLKEKKHKYTAMSKLSLLNSSSRKSRFSNNSNISE